ncbi:MAG: glutathione S-transferase family protein [Gammaproteobacteria bacterium]|nr:glutathione S-transferase family protein [Gammaproteobacteria bacterium]
MLTLYGTPVSNFYNKVKLALLEKGIPFVEEFAAPSQEPEFLEKSPMGKIPFIKDSNEYIFESGVILEYIESLYPQKNRLMPATPWAAAVCRSIITIIELYLDGPARRLLPAAFFGAPTTPEEVQNVQAELDRGVAALKRLVKFNPCIAGGDLSYADICAITVLPMVSMVMTTLGGKDPLADWKELQDYFAFLRTRPHVQRVEAEAKAAREAFIASKK